MGKIALNNGLLAGLIGVAISLLGTVTGIYDMADDFQGERGWESTIASAISFAVLIYFIIKSTKEYRDTELEGMMSYWDALKVGLLTGFIASIVSALYLLIFLTMIEPGLIEELRENALFELEEQNMGEDEFETAKSFMGFFMNPAIFAITGIFSGTFMALIISLITSIFHKTK